MFGSIGSKCTRRAPRGEHGVRPRNTSVGVVGRAVRRVALARPARTSAPPSVERQSPKCGAPGMFAPRSTPVQQVLLMPREPWAPEPTKIVVESPGLTWIEPMPRPAKYCVPIGPAPVVAAVLRLVEADAGDTAAAAGVRLTGSGVDHVARRVVRDRARAPRCCCAGTPRRRTPTSACAAKDRCPSARYRRPRSRSSSGSSTRRSSGR